jgi:hypothetical protein
MSVSVRVDMNGIRSDEQVQQAVHEWLRYQPKEFFS